MPKVTAAVAALLLVLVLAGCGDDDGDTSAKSEKSEQSKPSSQAVSESPEPLAAETQEPSSADEQFLAYVRKNVLPETQIPNATDEQLIVAGHDACDQLDSGVPLEDVRVVDGETPHENGNYYDTSAIMNGAITAYCPKYL